MNATIIFFVVLSVIMFIFPKQIMGLIISGDSQQMIALAAEHLRIMTPLLLIGGIVGIYYGLLIIYKGYDRIVKDIISKNTQNKLFFS